MNSFVMANLIVGKDGSTTLSGRSKWLSSPEDRRRFHELRKSADCILIGGNTARTEPYSKTPVDLYVLSHNELPENVRLNPRAKILNCNLSDALASLKGKVLIEAGASLVSEGLANNLIDEFYLTSVDMASGENCIDIAELTKGYVVDSREEIGDDIFLRFVQSPHRN